MQYCIGFYKGIFLNHQLKVTDEELASYGLDDPELTVRVDYTDDGTSDTFVLHISRAPEERKEAADSGSEADTADITDYTRIGDFKIIYRLSGSSYETLIAADYDDLRNQEISPGDFGEVNSIEATLENVTYTIASQKDGKALQCLYDDLQKALEALTVEEFTSEKATGQLEASLTLHLGNEGHPEVMISLYRYNGSSCLAAIDGKSVAYVLRSEVVELMEAVRAIVLN